jgi:glycosyltransferase involved in cell wall biosynthesis
MKVNIVTERESQRWSLLYDAENLARHIDGATVGDKVDPTAHVNMFVNYALYVPVNTVRTAMFTHHEERYAARWDEAAEGCHWCFAMCRKAYEMLPNRKASVMRFWPHPQFHRQRPLVIGICGRDYRGGRKRMGWVDSIRLIPGVVVKVTGGDYKWEELPEYYDSLDYLVVISGNEGGPKPVIEAIARGVPVIAPDVGFCWEHPVIRYDGTKANLLATLRGLVMPEDGWAETAEEVQAVHERLVKWLDK